jgi:malonyl-CoA O-methyltransferase
MLLRSRSQRPWWRRGLAALTGSRTCAVCADMERLPFADRSFDMIWSNLALNWADTPEAVFAECWRALRPGGVFMFSTAGPDTLMELRDAYAAVDRHVHVNRFMDMHDLGDCLVHTRFADPVMDMEYITLSYPDVGARVAADGEVGARRAEGERRAQLQPRPQRCAQRKNLPCRVYRFVRTIAQERSAARNVRNRVRAGVEARARRRARGWPRGDPVS